MLPAVAEDRDPVAVVEDLHHAVRDVDDRNAARGEVAHDPEQHLCLGLGQCRGRLVEDEDAAIERQRLGNLDELLARDRERPDQHGRVDRAERRQRRAGALVQRLVVHEPFPARVDLGHEDVLRHRHVRAERDLLVDEADPEFLRAGRRGDLHRLAVQDDLATVGAQDAVDDVHQRRFPGAVLAGDGVHLAAAQLEVDAAQRLDRAERFADVRRF